MSTLSVNLGMCEEVSQWNEMHIRGWGMPGHKMHKRCIYASSGPNTAAGVALLFIRTLPPPCDYIPCLKYTKLNHTPRTGCSMYIIFIHFDRGRALVTKTKLRLFRPKKRHLSAAAQDAATAVLFLPIL